MGYTLVNMKLKKNIATSEEGFVFNPSTGDSFSTNPIGAEILSMLKDGKTVAQISAAVCSRYDVEPILFERDLADFIASLRSYKMIE